MENNKICISNLLKLANEYDIVKHQIDEQNEKDTQNNLDKMIDKKNSLEKEIYNTIRERDKEDRSELICEINWYLKEKQKKENAFTNYKFSLAPAFESTNTILDIYFNCFAQEKLSSTMQIFKTTTNSEIGEVLNNVRKEVKDSALIENLFVRGYLAKIKGEAVEKTETSQDRSVLKKCTQIIACENILQDIIEQEMDISMLNRDTDKSFGE